MRAETRVVRWLILLSLGASLGAGGWLALSVANFSLATEGADLRWLVPILLGGALGALSLRAAVGGAASFLTLALACGDPAELVVPSYVLAAVAGRFLRSLVGPSRRG